MFNGWHTEPMRGTMEEAIAYCSKAETRDDQASFGFCEFGQRPVFAGAAGGRSDLFEVAEAVSAGKRLTQVARDFPEQFIKYHKGIAALHASFSTGRNWVPSVYWFYGPTGTGKTRAASSEDPDCYWKNCSNKWWDGYEGQATVILDDYRPDFCKFSELLRILDRYTYQIEFKGGVTQLLAHNIYITTPKSPQDTWANRTEEDIAQLLRRITQVKHFANLETHDRT